MSRFVYEGRLPASKSMMNRALLIQSFATRPDSVRVDGQSECDDVVAFRRGLDAFRSRKVIDCGEGGTVLRFLLARVSREPGQWSLTGSARLLSRPHAGLLSALQALGVEVVEKPESLQIIGTGWRRPTGPIFVDRSVSSQFLSALLLCSWSLPFDLEFRFEETSLSAPYLEMTLAMLRTAGMELERSVGRIRVPEAQTPRGVLEAEPDLSSAFSLAALAALDGAATFSGFPESSTQADSVFPEILERMGARVSRPSRILRVESAGRLRGISVDLSRSPDLFPVLAVLAACAEGPSRFEGATHLSAKESDRLEKTMELVRALGRQVRVVEGGCEILSEPSDRRSGAFDFDPDQDHRLVMAAELARRAGLDLRISDPGCVSKSFPEYWSIVGGRGA